MQKFMCYCTVLALFHFGFEDNFRVQGPGVDLEARFVGFLRYEFGGLMHGEVIFWILRYILI